MSTESDLKIIYSDLISGEPGSKECKEAMQRLNMKDPYQTRELFPIIFNDNFGVIKCITEGSRRRKTTSIRPLVKWIHKLVDEFAHLLAEYADKLMVLCCQLDSSDVFAIHGCEIVCTIVRKAPWIFFNVRRFSNDIRTVFIPFLGAVEVLIEKYPDQLNDYYSGLWQKILNTLHQHAFRKVGHYFYDPHVLQKNFTNNIASMYMACNVAGTHQESVIVMMYLQIASNDSQSLVLPLTNILLKLKIHFSPNDSQCTLLYKFFATQIGDSSHPSYSTYDVFLPLFAKCMHIFGKDVLENHELWHGHFLRQIKKKLELSSYTSDFDYTVKYAIDEFYQNVFSLEGLELKNMYEYFGGYLNSCLKNQSLKFYDANCLILWSARSPFDQQFLESLVHFTISTIQRSGAHKIYLISISTQSICLIIGHNISMFEKYQHFIVNLMDSLFLHELGGNDYVVHSLQVYFLNIPFTSDHALKAFVFRNMLKHCSMKWPICPQLQISNVCEVKSCVGCSYSRFWKKLMDIDFFFGSQVNELLGFSRSAVEAKFELVWSLMIEFVFHLSSTLNFTLCKNNDPKSHDMKMSSTSGFLAESSGDVTLHSNVIQLLSCIMDGIPSSVWKDWSNIFLLETFLLSGTYPYISGFCKLVTMGLKLNSNLLLHEKIKDSGVYFGAEMSTLKQFFLNCFYHCQTFDGELQLAYVHLLLNIPTNYVVEFLDHLLPFFQLVFELSKSNPHSAICAVSSIRKWMLYVEKDKLKPIISTLVPLIIALIRVEQGTGGRRKIKQTVETSTVLREILMLLAYMDSSVLDPFYPGFQCNSGGAGNLLNIKLSTNDLSMNLNLEFLLPQVFYLSSHSSNFEERLRSCELLRLIGCYMLGKGSQVEDAEHSSFSELFKKVISHCLNLAQDSQPMIRGIFNQFIIQCTNIFSCKLVLKELSKVFTESLLDYMMQPRSYVSLGVCFGFLQNLLKTGTQDSDLMCQTNIDLIMNNVSQNLLHPCCVRRKGAALALISIERVLFSESWSYDKYCLYLIHLAILHLKAYPEGCYHILEILEAIRKAVGTHHHVLHEMSESRISPPGFASIKLEDTISWLTLQAVSCNPLTTAECCSLLSSLAPCLPGLQDSRAMINSYGIQTFTSRSFDAFSDLYSKIETSDLNELLKSYNVTCHMRFFCWLIENCDTQFLGSRNWIFIEVVGSFLKNLVTCAKETLERYPLRIWEIHTTFNSNLQEEFFVVFLELLAKLESKTPSTTKILAFLNHSSYFTSFLWKFLIEPSSLNVRFETHSYSRLCEDRLVKMSVSIESTNGFMSDLFVKIELLLKRLPDVFCTGFDRSQFELFHCVGLLNDGVLSKKDGQAMKKMMKGFSDALVCSVAHNKSIRVHKHLLSKLLKFILSLGTFEEVCSELFDCIFSHAVEALKFYDLFEHEILNFIIGGIEECHWKCFGDGTCFMKIKIINKMISKSNSVTLTNKFAMCVMKFIAKNWQNVVSSVKTDCDLYILLDCLLQIANTLTPDVECFSGSQIEVWLRDQVLPGSSAHLILPLIPYMDSSFSSKFIADFEDKDEALLYIMCNSFIVGHFKVVSYCLKNIQNHLKLHEAYDLISSQFSNFDPVCQSLVLNHMLQHGLEVKTTNLKFHLEVFSCLIMLCTVSARKKFFTDNISGIIGILSRELDPSSDEVKHEELLNQKSLCFLLTGILYGMFDKNEMFGPDGFVNKSSGNKLHDTLRLDVIKLCYKLQSCKQEAYDGFSYVESWRICQCTALNCLLVILCSNTLSSKVLQHFVFHDKTDKTSNPILETIIDSNQTLKFISWQEAKLMKKKREKMVNTGIKVSCMPSDFNCRSSYVDISIASISQECKAFDFIGHAEIPLSQNFTSVVKVDLEGDTLSGHVCLPYLCSTINKTVVCGITSSSVKDVMPDWMASFNALLRNPSTSKHVKSFIIKIVHKCKDVFKTYAACWTAPILYSLVSLECCGEVTSYFFYQVVTMLISWLPLYDQNHEKDIDKKLWNRLVEKTVGAIAGCLSEDISHLLNILRFIFVSKRGVSPPCTTLMALLEKKSTHILQVALKVCCMLFEHGFCPYTPETLETFLGSIKNILFSKDIGESAAVVVGYALKNAPESDQQMYTELIEMELNKLEQLHNRGGLFLILRRICQHFPVIVKKYLPIAFIHLNNPKSKTLHKDIMGVLESYVSAFPNSDVFFELKRNRCFEFLVSKSSTHGAKLSGLSILRSFVGCGHADVMNFIVRYLLTHSAEFSSYSLKSLMNEIVAVSTVSSRSTTDGLDPSLASEVNSWLFKSLLDESHAGLQKQLIRCIMNDHIWKRNTPESMMKLLEAIPDGYMNRNISTCLVNTLLLRSLDSYNVEDTICGDITVGDGIEESFTSTNPVNIVSSSVPLFVETIRDANIFNPTSVDEDDGLSSEYSSFHETGLAVTIKTKMREVKDMQSYGNKKFPGIRITFIETISIILSLCKVNSRISGAVFDNLFNSIMNVKTDDRLIQRFKTLIPILLKKLVKKSTANRNLVSPLLNLCWKYCISLSPVLLYDVCKTFNTRETGLLLAEQNISSAPNISILPDYKCILSMFHEDLGHVELSSSFMKITPCSYQMAESMESIFSQNIKLKELALLSDWDQLNLELQKVDMIDLHFQWDNRGFRRFLDYRILSEVNAKMLRKDASFTGSLLEWIEKNKAFRDLFEWELRDDVNLLYLAHNRLDDFKFESILSAFNWTYFMGLDSQASPIHHQVKLKKCLDNYVMALSLSEPDGSLFYNHLQIDELYYPENLILWHQLIINRGYFLSFVDEHLEVTQGNSSQSNPRKPYESILKLQSDYLKFLISNGDLMLIKKFAPAFCKDSNDLLHKNYLVQNSKIHLLELRRHQDRQRKLDCLWMSWNCLNLEEGFNREDVALLLQLASLCSEFISYVDLDSEKIKRAIMILTSEVDHLSLKEAIIHCGHESVSRACIFTDRNMMADVLEITTDFCLKYSEDSSLSHGLKDKLNETIVRCILKSLALGKNYGHHMFLKALNIVLDNTHSVSVFQTESSKIDVSLLTLWLPQLIGYLNLERAHINSILEPMFMRLAEKCPQKLWLILNLNQTERLGTNSIARRVLLNLEAQTSGKKFIEALGTVCHPNLLLRSYVNRFMKAEGEETVLKLYSEIKEKCFFNPHQGKMVGRIFMINDQYKEMIDGILNQKKQSYQFSDQEIKRAMGNIEVQRLDNCLRLESFSPVLFAFNFNTFTFEIPCTGCSEKNNGPNFTALASFNPSVTIIPSLRKPVKIEMLGTDGKCYPWIVKFDEDLRQDQYIQQFFTIINESMKRRKNWTKENVITYEVVPFTSHFGIIEMVNPAVTMSALINTAFDDAEHLRNSLKDKHSKWIHQSLPAIPKEKTTTAYALAAKFYSADEISSSFAVKSSLVPKDLLRTCLFKFCNSPQEYFSRRLNFLRSHTVLSLCHWVIGVGDRHLNNFLLSTKTCEIIGIDFGLSFGAGLECSPVPELVPFRLTPQFFSSYYPLYKSGILEDIMAKCFASIDHDMILLAMQVLVHLPLHDVYQNSKDNISKDSAAQHANWIIESVQRKLKMENPLDVACMHLNNGKLDQYSVNIYLSLLQRFSPFLKPSSPHELVKMLIELASDKVLLGISYHNFEPWI